MEKPVPPAQLFHFHLTDGSEGLIVLEHVCMTRWAKSKTTALNIYFKEGPHVTLGEDEGVAFEDILKKYHEYSKSCHEYAAYVQEFINKR